MFSLYLPRKLRRTGLILTRVALRSALAILPLEAVSGTTTVTNADEFRRSVAVARPGDHILLAPGVYRGGFHFSNVRGTEAAPISIRAADPGQLPVIDATEGGVQFSAPSFLELSGLMITNSGRNALNLDDGGAYDQPARGIVLTNLIVQGTGPEGNWDGIKLSGVMDFKITGCRIERWGTGGGSGIDMVGCHQGQIESNRLQHTEAVTSTGIQAKGGTSQVLIRRNYFKEAGGRAINIGGSTGLEFFRPPLAGAGPFAEARAITVEGNTFVGGGTPVAFVGVDGATVRFNTIYVPRRWALRILQENRAEGFVPSRGGTFTDNLVVFDSRQWAEGGVNIGPGTEPGSFKFARNFWFCLDQPARSRPRLPTEESGGVYGQFPQFRNAEAGDFRPAPGSPAERFGAGAL